ncbi:mannitol dehydrogenase family protein [Trueperella pecoris]|uniref:Mannitol-1-phosphate 5-dehydrogenase n=1 Tax=Trueperella pecoris TaxID=2733571 RepID=A0A7M1QVT8_9ACTO|nr:mannitol dehydrogenase family protein [Trueperella pecoris]QOR45931.1 mannitol dehydrogenase family protein [Trueperella pecoris]
MIVANPAGPDIPRLSRHNAPRELRIGASAPQETGIVHIGLAQFHRAHAAVATAQALAAEPGPWGIVGIAPHSPKNVRAMREQDFLYSILQLTPEGESVGIVDVHRDALVAAEDPQAAVDAIAAAHHKIVTLTVSEVGYRKDPERIGLNLDDAETVADFANKEAPTTVIGLIARGLERRFAQGGAPVTILSCDNMQSAGTLTRALVLEFLKRAEASPEIFDWIDAHVTFPNAMVDRIVPATTDATRQRVAELTGVWDEAPVPAEAFTMWVLEDKFAAGRPAWERADGVVFSDEVEKYEQVKLRLLNGSHSLISYLGALDGRETIPASRTQPFVEECVRRAIEDEFLPSIDLPSSFDAAAYVDQLFIRWTNFALGDLVARVGSDGSAKILQRVPIPALRLLRMGKMPEQMALLVAAWIACVCPPAGFEPGEIARAMVEPKRDFLREATAGVDLPTEHAHAVLTSGLFPQELAEHDAFVARVGELLELIVNDGVRAAASEALRGV